MDATAYLKEWTKHFFKNRDIITKQIESITEEADGLLIKRKDKEEKVMVKPALGNADEFTALDKTKRYALIVLNNKANADKLIEIWNTLKMVPNLVVYFINPFSSTDLKWVIQPAVHEKIMDRLTFKTGIYAMFETVQPITLQELEQKAE